MEVLHRVPIMEVKTTIEIEIAEEMIAAIVIVMMTDVIEAVMMIDVIEIVMIAEETGVAEIRATIAEEVEDVEEIQGINYF
jgi:hypothetical protein